MIKSYSKEGQDYLAKRLIGEKGYFLDIGCNSPKLYNNTYLLEQLGWTGILIDINSEKIEECKKERLSPAFEIDCSNFTRNDWLRLLELNHAPKVIDYISLDADDANIDFMENFPFDEYEFKVMTYETDLYSCGNKRKDIVAKVLSEDYALLLDNAKLDSGGIWEDWWINEKYLDYKKFYAKEVYWLDFLKTLGVKFPEPVAILIGGGLGDCIWSYFYDEYNRKLLSVKEEHNLHVTCYVHSNNSQAIELLRYNPHVDVIYSEQYREVVPRYVPALHHVFDLSKYKDQPMPIYLGEDEKSALAHVASHGEYVVIHPFAAEDRRAFWKELPSFISKIANKYNVVVIGGSFIREGSEAREEAFTFSHPRVMNLVNIASVRLCCELVKNAKYFIGSHSCYQMAAWAHGIKSLCLVPESLVGYLSPHVPTPENPTGLSYQPVPYVSHLFHPGNKVMFFEQLPHIQRFLDEFFIE